MVCQFSGQETRQRRVPGNTLPVSLRLIVDDHSADRYYFAVRSGNVSPVTVDFFVSSQAPSKFPIRD